MIERGAWPLVDADAMRALDRHTIDVLGVPGDLLMESAGRAVTGIVLEQLAETAGRAVAVVCGRGNNGGDGFVVARHLHLLGVPVRVSLLCRGSDLAGDAAANFARAERVGVPIEESATVLPEALLASGVVVDSVFGTGLSRDVEGASAAAIDAIDTARERSGGATRVVAVDLPSGLDADTGQVLGRAVRADVTATISLPKLGLALEPGRAHAGSIRVLRIGIADEAPGVESRAVLWSPAAAGARLPARVPQGHKGTFGHVLLVAGGEGKTGAAALSALGAGRAGAGLITIACPAGLNDILEVKCTEAMTVPVPDLRDRTFAAAAEKPILELAAERSVVAIGPGVGRGKETVALMRALAAGVEQPLVIDADGLFAFADALDLLSERAAPTILTPHPGEAARLLDCGSADVNRDRVGSARSLAARAGSIVLLKGAATIAAHPDGRVVVNPTGGPGLGTGGTGDVLLGVVAALASQGLAPLDAAALSAYVHGAAGDRLDRGTGGLLATEVAAEVPAAAAALVDAASARGELGAGLALPFPGS